MEGCLANLPWAVRPAKYSRARISHIHLFDPRKPVSALPRRAPRALFGGETFCPFPAVNSSPEQTLSSVPALPPSWC